jgi:hypothetical protein
MRVKKLGQGMSEWYTLQWPYLDSITFLENTFNLRTATGNEVPSVASSNEEEATK